jgi:FAD/FMN-containing dehydrogenase
MSLPIPVGSITRTEREAVIASLQQLLGDRLSTAAAVRERHGKDASYHPCMPPDAVAFPHSTPEVSEIVKICARHKVPLIPFGGGTSFEGHVAALSGGVCIDMAQMNRILQVNADDFDATMEAGVTLQQLNDHLHDSGLFFSIDPGAAAQTTLGGMAATRASGTNTVRYGTMRENALALTVVLPDGRIIRTARRARKSSAGYDLTRLFVGSEGTLGVITEVTVRLYAVPPAMSSIIGHVGDGNFHVAIPLHSANPQEIAQAACLNERLVQRALALEGTCTGEHGIGYGKLDFLVSEHGEAVSVMRAIKQALDPDNLMNPGKILRV